MFGLESLGVKVFTYSWVMHPQLVLPEGSHHQSDVPRKCLSPKAKFDKSLLRVFEIQTKSSCSMQCACICANRHPALQ